MAFDFNTIKSKFKDASAVPAVVTVIAILFALFSGLTLLITPFPSTDLHVALGDLGSNYWYVCIPSLWNIIHFVFGLLPMIILLARFTVVATKSFSKFLVPAALVVMIVSMFLHPVQYVCYCIIGWTDFTFKGFFGFFDFWFVLELLALAAAVIVPFLHKLYGKYVLAGASGVCILIVVVNFFEFFSLLLDYADNPYIDYPFLHIFTSLAGFGATILMFAAIILFVFDDFVAPFVKKTLAGIMPKKK
ncbi:MAG: hypothetical protein IJ426_03200 [Clostridia bacterium]|nr:hypothetical protein [Clostridia bacterium]